MSATESAQPSRRPVSSPAPRREGAARSHLHVAPDSSRRRRRTRIAVWGSALVTAVALFVLVSFHVVAVQHAFELDSLQKQRNEEELRYERLRAQVASLSSPQAVVEAAEAQGMVPAETVGYLDAAAAAPRSQPTDDKTARTLAGTADEKKRIDP